MALFMKQDFCPPLLSRKWIAIKLRPNMLIYSREHIISILESGLLFREDCAEVEQEAPSQFEVWSAAGGSRGGWFTRGELVASGFAILACLLVCPPRNLQRSSLVRAAAYALAPVCVRAAHRRRCGGGLRALLARMREYLTLARRAAAMCREYAALHADLGSLSSVIESTQTMLCRQQSELAVLMSRASSAVLGNAPWLRDDVAWDAVTMNGTENLMKIHHAFLVVQSTLLKHIAMAHYLPPLQAQRMYKNHNERVYWIHNVLLKHLTDEFDENYATLERMYRLLKNYGASSEPKRPGHAVKDSWLYSDVHTDIARANLELKLAVKKCNSIDMFLDACAINEQQLDVDILNRDIEGLIENLTKCLATAQNSQIRLKKLHRKYERNDSRVEENARGSGDEEEAGILRIEDKEPEIRDEVFYFVKTEEEDVAQAPEDVTTGPGKKEKETTKVVMNELKRKLVKREDAMRVRERRALAETMPELKTLPDFPRQIKLEEFPEQKGFITKIKITKKQKRKAKLPFLGTRNKLPNTTNFNVIKRGRLKIETYTDIQKIPVYVCEVNTKLELRTALISVSRNSGVLIVTKWCKLVKQVVMDEIDRDHEEAKNVPYESRLLTQNENDNNFRVSKNDLELSSSGSESGFDLIERAEILKDLRRHRVNRKKNTKATDIEDEGLRPMEYSLGTGLAMASVLQINSFANRPNMAEEEFIGDGEVSDDSGHDDE